MKNFKDFTKSLAGKKDSIPEEITNQLMNSTGFMYMDYMNGGSIISYDENEIPISLIHNVGLMSGSLNLFVSKSNVGKTSLAVRLGAGIIEPWIKEPLLRRYINADNNKDFNFETGSLIQILDSEQTIDMNMIQRITDYPTRLLEDVFSITQVTTDVAVRDAFKWHVEFKKKTMTKIVTPFKDIFGNYIKSYPPTVVILDSANKIQVAYDKELLEDKEYDKFTSNTAGATRAKRMSALMDIITNYAKKYNIIILSINHINIAPNMSVLPPSKQLPGLPPGVTIAGGERTLYLAANIFELKIFKAIGGEKSGALKWGNYIGTDEEITGSITTIRIVKSKTNRINSIAKLVFTHKNAFDPLYSTMFQAIDDGDLEASGNSVTLEGFPDIKLNMRNFKDKFVDNPALLTAFIKEVTRKASRLLSSKDDLAKIKKENDKLAKESGINVDEDSTSLDELYNDL